MNEDEVSGTLKKVVPHRELPAGMLAGARRRRRRTRALKGSGVLALVVAVVVPLSLSFGGSDSQMVATPAPTPSHTAADEPTALEPEACRDEDGNYPTVTDLPNNELPLGVERVWLCGGPSDSPAADTYVGPPEPLTRNADWAVAVFMEPAPTVGSFMCEVNDSVGFTVVYEYPNGESYTVQGSLGGCDAVVSGTTYRMGAGEYLEELQSLWNEQRKQEDTSFDAEVDVCPAKTSVMGVGIADMTRAWACIPVGDDGSATEAVQKPLSEALVEDIVEEITSQDVMAGFQPGLAMTAPSLVFLSPQGDPFTIQGTPQGYSWYDPEPGGINVWKPSPELAERINAEIDGSAVVEPSPSSSHPEYDRVCGTDEQSSPTPTDLPGNTLPDGPEAVWLCSGAEPGAIREPLLEKRAMQQVVDSFRALPSSPGEENSPMQTFVHVVVEYADGERYVVEADTTGTFEVRWGEERQEVRYGGKEWMTLLRSLWGEQRDNNPRVPPVAPEVGVCDSMIPSMGRSLERYDVDGALCAVVRGESGVVEGVEIPAPAQLIADARTQAQSSSVPWAPTDQNPLVDWDGATIMLVDDYGDRLPLLRVAPDTWFWQQGDKAWEWTPTPELTLRLDQAFDAAPRSPQPTNS